MTVDEGSQMPSRLLRKYRFALIDRDQLQSLPVGLPLCNTAGGFLKDSESLLPRLLALHQLSSAQCDELGALMDRQYSDGQSQAVCALLQGDCNTERMISHLAAAQQCQGPAGTRAWLRLHDPRVWLQLPRITPARRLASLFGPIRSWAMYANKQWWVTQPPLLDTPVVGVVQHMDALQWSAMQRLGAVNRALAALGLHDMQGLQKHSARLDELVQRAQQRHGLSSADDLAAYACFGWQLHTRFDEHPQVLQAIADQRSADARDAHIIDVLNALTPDQQEQIRADLNDPGRQEPAVDSIRKTNP